MYILAAKRAESPIYRVIEVWIRTVMWTNTKLLLVNLTLDSTPSPFKHTGEFRHIDPFAKFVLSSYTGMHRINIHIHEVSKKLKKEFKNKRYFSAHKKRHLMKMIVVTAVHSHLIWEILNLTFDNLWYWSICLLVSTNENR